MTAPPTRPVLGVDLSAFARNLRAVRSRVSPAQLMLVVKDDAYGHGVRPIVQAAHAEGVRWIGAFDVATALTVRSELGPGPRVFSWLVFGRDDADDAAEAGLDVGVGDVQVLEETAAAARRRGVRTRVHLKIDTGLHRNGIRPEDWPAVLARVQRLQTEGLIELVGVWSHISEASDADDDDARAAFERAVPVSGAAPVLRHLAASAASFARPEFRYDLVRVGAFCYGIRSAGGPTEASLGIERVAALDAPVTEVRADDRAIVAIGALHGLPSTLAGRVEITTPAGPRRLVEVGALSCVVEGWAGAWPGQCVRVYGPGARSVTDLAEAIDTIGEEIAVRLSPLIERRYLRS